MDTLEDLLWIARFALGREEVLSWKEIDRDTIKGTCHCPECGVRTVEFTATRQRKKVVVNCPHCGEFIP